MPDTSLDPGLLDPVGAAIRLGVSPELLFHYSRRDTRTLCGSFRLRSSSVGGRTLFAVADLDAFDVRLGEPRSETGGRRAKVPSAVTAHLKVEAGGGCARCTSGIGVQDAHIEAYERTRSNHHRNLVRLCSPCHEEYDRGVIPRAEVEAVKARLVEATHHRLLVGGRTPPARLPPRRPLHGRARELRVLASALRTGRSVIVHGVGGIGKTQVLLHALEAADTGRPCVWLDMEGCPSEAVLAGYVRVAASRIGTGEPEEVLSGVRARVVLDGVERAACGPSAVLGTMRALLSEGLDVQVVVTSQATLPEMAFDEELRVGRLSEAAARLLLPTPRRGGDRMPRLLEVGDGHPLTLQVLAALLRHFGDARTVSDRLSARPNLPVEMPGRADQRPGTSLDLCLGVALDALGDHGRRALRVVAQFPAGLATRLHDLTALGMVDPEAALAELTRWHLVDDSDLWGSRLLTMLSPVRAYVRRALCGDAGAEMDDVARRVAFCTATMVEGMDGEFIHGGRVEDGVAVLDRELPNVVEVVQTAIRRSPGDAGFRLIAKSLAGGLQTYLFSAGHFDVGAELMTAVADLEMAAGERSEALETLSQLLSLADRGGRRDLAAETLGKARLLADGGGPAAQAILLTMESAWGTGQGPRRAGSREDVLRAAAMAARAFDLLVSENGGETCHRAAIALFQRACHLEDAGRPGEALPLLDEALSFFEAVADPINGGSTLQRRGNCLASQERNREAVESYVRSAVLFHRLGTVDYRSNALGEAGLVLADHHDVPCPRDVAVDVLTGGIDDVTDRIVRSMSRWQVPGNGWPYVLTRKACGLIALASLVGPSEALARFGARLRCEVVDVLLRREPHAERAEGFVSVVTAHFGALAWLCEEVAATEAASGPVRSSDVERLAVVIEGMFRGDMRDTMFSWLARHLAERRGVVGVSAGMIRAAVDGLAYDEPFELPGLGDAPP